MSNNNIKSENFTKGQLLALNERDKNILVSACAGSGKTYTLVSRVLMMLINGDVDIDQICVVTFTNAAAKEMKSKIKDAIVAKLNELNNIDSLTDQEKEQVDRLNKANLHIDFANISTLHGFCKKLIEENYKDLGLSPNFTEILGADRDAMMDECLDIVFEREYKNQGFREFVLSYTDKYNDDQLKTIVKSYYEFLTTVPHKKEWFDKISRTNNSEKYVAGIELIREFIPSNPKLPYVKEGKKKTSEDNNKSIKLKYSPKTLKMVDELFSNQCKILDDLVIKFDDEFAGEKKRKNVLDFSDLEKYALELLYKKVDGNLSNEISDLGKEIADSFKQIFVDEYQDINNVQEEIIRAISNNYESNNLFLVGDVKQSIYLFRHARPNIFMKKYQDYGSDIGGKLINMNDNFRSSKDLLDSVNSVFYDIMDENYGDIKYDKDQALEFARKDPYKAIDKKTEFLNLCFDGDKLRQFQEKNENKKKKARNFTINRPYLWGGDPRYLSNRTNMYAEGIMIGKRILELIAETKDKKDQEKVHFSDIAILVNKNSDGLVYKAALDELGIGSQVGTDTDDFFKSDEVRLMKEILNVINNPRSDIPLTAVLRSEIIGMSNEELAQIVAVAAKDLKGASKGSLSVEGINDNQLRALTKSHDFEKYIYDDKNVRLYDKIIYFMQSQNENPQYKNITTKLDKFIYLFDKLRKKSKYSSLVELIKYIYDETNLKIIISSWNNPRRSLHNLDVLAMFAENFNAQYKGLYDFLKLINKMYTSKGNVRNKKKTDDEIVANLDILNPDCVKIITIHSSKGLQFPIVFLAGIDSKFVERQFAGYKENRFIFDMEEGICFDPIDSKRNEYTTLKRFYVNLINKRKYRAEKLRLFYVALTRAKDKLIITSSKGIPYTISNDDKSDKKSATPFFTDANSKSRVFNKITECTSFVDYLSYLVELNKKEEGMNVHDILSTKYSIYDRYYDVEDLFNEVKKMANTGEPGVLASHSETILIKDNIIEEAKSNLENIYPYSESTQSVPKISVSEIAKRHDIIYESIDEFSKEESDDHEEMIYGSNDVDDIFSNNVSTKDSSSDSSNAIAKGNGYHRFMQILDYSKIDLSSMSDEQVLSEINNQKSKFIEQKLGKSEELNLVEPDKILEFLKSSMGELFIKSYASGSLHREQPFMKVLTKSEIKTYSAYEDLSPMGSENESQIVQGVIDAFIIDGDSFTVIDYKTDAISKYGDTNGREILIKRYENQLRLYSKALSEILGKSCKGMYIYSFDLSKVIEINKC